MNYCDENYVCEKKSTIAIMIDNVDNVDNNDESDNCSSAIRNKIWPFLAKFSISKLQHSFFKK